MKKNTKLLTLILVLGMMVGIFAAFGITAGAEESEVLALPDITLEAKTYKTVQEMGTGDFADDFRAALPKTIETTYENGVLTAQNIKAASAYFYSFTDDNAYDMTLVDGYWTVEIDESVYSDGNGIIYYYGTNEEWNVQYNNGELEYIRIYGLGNTFDIFDSTVAYMYTTEEGFEITDYYDEDGNIVRNSVRTFGDLDVAASYNSNREPQYFEIIGNDFWCCYLPGQGWSSSLGEYQPIDAPAGLENVDFEYLMNYATCTIPCDHNWVEADCDTPKTCSVCKATEGEALGHDYIDATTEAPKTCKNCGATDGEPLPKPAEPVTPDEPAETNWFIRIWNAILDFFRKLFGIKQ